MADPNDPKITTTKGPPQPGTPKGAAPEPIDPETGQHGAYWVLTEEERARGFVRPVRRSYLHSGVKVVHPLRPTTDEEKEVHGQDYAAFEVYPESERPATGRLLTRKQMHGCGGLTKMGEAIAETYARDPSFYGSTFCVSCGQHYPVAEFTWDGTDEVVGS